jgi:hypothetical protein
MSNEQKYVWCAFDDDGPKSLPWARPSPIGTCVGFTRDTLNPTAKMQPLQGAWETYAIAYRDDLRGGWHIVPEGVRYAAVKGVKAGQRVACFGNTEISERAAKGWTQRLLDRKRGADEGTWEVVKYDGSDAWCVLDLHDLADHRAKPDAPRYIVKPASEMAEGEPCRARRTAADVARKSNATRIAEIAAGDAWPARWPVDGIDRLGDAPFVCAIVDTHSPEWQAFQRERGKGDRGAPATKTKHSWSRSDRHRRIICDGCGRSIRERDIAEHGIVALADYLPAECREALLWSPFSTVRPEPRNVTVTLGDSFAADSPRSRAKLLGQILGGVDTRPSDHAEAMGYAWRHVAGVDPGKEDATVYAYRHRVASEMKPLKPPGPTDAEIVAAWEAVWRWNEAPAATRGSAPHGCEWDLDG